jgi:hypothetical protein
MVELTEAEVKELLIVLGEVRKYLKDLQRGADQTKETLRDILKGGQGPE